MKKYARQVASKLCPLWLCLVLVSFPAAAQQQPDRGARPDANEEEETQATQSGNQTISLLQELNLSDEQKRQIRDIKEEHEQPLREALWRRRLAQRALEEAFYSDRTDEPLIQARSRALADAQAELARLRTAIELRIRRVLTPAQLIRFREIRREARLRAGQRPGLNRALRESGTEPGRSGRAESPAERRARRSLRQADPTERRTPLRRPGLRRQRF